MASSKDYLNYVLKRLTESLDLSYRPMMGEYVIYSQGKVIGGIYDDRFLLKKTKTALELLKDTGNIQTATPYEGAKEMLVADIDDKEMTCRLIEAIVSDLPEPKKKK
ncbi:MAG: competence protein TfoX [Erysipelotrichaceae bacterium]|nr:competence protein TfoX [Erysipelotrichaceae bacterium]